MGMEDRDYYWEDRARREKAGASPLRAVLRNRGSRSPWLFWIVVILVGTLLSMVALGVRQRQPFPPTGLVLWYIPEPTGPTAPLSLQAPMGNANFVVKFDAWETGAPVAMMPIRAGELSRIQMPLGRYRMTIIKGLFWRGPGKLFQITTDSRQAVDPVEFFRVGNTYNGQTIQLETLAGNMDTRPTRVPF